MTSPLKAERINGHTPATWRDDNGRWHANCVCDCKSKPAVIQSDRGYHTESRALESLVAAVLNEHRQIALGRDGWACRKCGSMRGLSVHHKVFRSHGRDDRLGNLETNCTPCHEQAHKEKSA